MPEALLPMFYLELVTGIRKGELTALLWSDLDEGKRTISVSKQCSRGPDIGNCHHQPTKDGELGAAGFDSPDGGGTC